MTSKARPIRFHAYAEPSKYRAQRMTPVGHYATNSVEEVRQIPVSKDGNRHYLTVPKEWRGRRVVVLLLEESDARGPAA